jgi:hypothetical protein
MLRLNARPPLQHGELLRYQRTSLGGRDLPVFAGGEHPRDYTVVEVNKIAEIS